MLNKSAPGGKQAIVPRQNQIFSYRPVSFFTTAQTGLAHWDCEQTL
jgi:hypothetical protein